MTFHYRNADAGRHRAVLPAGLASREDLFAALAAAIPLPDYFGHNWDALDECLSDLSFTGAGVGVVELIHADVPALPAPELATYLSILRDAVDTTGADGGGPQLEVVFPPAARQEIDAALAAAS